VLGSGHIKTEPLESSDKRLKRKTGRLESPVTKKRKLCLDYFGLLPDGKDPPEKITRSKKLEPVMDRSHLSRTVKTESRRNWDESSFDRENPGQDPNWTLDQPSRRKKKRFDFQRTKKVIKKSLGHARGEGISFKKLLRRIKRDQPEVSTQMGFLAVLMCVSEAGEKDNGVLEIDRPDKNEAKGDLGNFIFCPTGKKYHRTKLMKKVLEREHRAEQKSKLEKEEKEPAAIEITSTQSSDIPTKSSENPTAKSSEGKPSAKRQKLSQGKNIEIGGTSSIQKLIKPTHKNAISSAASLHPGDAMTAPRAALEHGLLASQKKDQGGRLTPPRVDFGDELLAGGLESSAPRAVDLEIPSS